MEHLEQFVAVMMPWLMVGFIPPLVLMMGRISQKIYNHIQERRVCKPQSRYFITRF